MSLALEDWVRDWTTNAEVNVQLGLGLALVALDGEAA